MNYNEMTDNDVAKAVVMAMGGREMCDGVFLCENKRYDIDSPQSNFNFDPCNSWADAGPIIAANKITISAPMKYDDPSDWLAYPSSDSDICVAHPNPLRAAMTVFLVTRDITDE